MDITYSYGKKRKDYGKQPLFCEVPPYLIDTINPNGIEQKRYGLRNPVHRESQVSLPYSEHYINSKRVELVEQGINHTEGGWPKDININDEEMVTRFKRRVERDDAYIDAVLNTYPKFHHHIQQNNAIEMYQMFFNDIPPAEPLEKYFMRLQNSYKDPDNRPISSLCWTVEDDPKLVVAYCYRQFPITTPPNKTFECFLWALENPNEPVSVLQPPSACWQIVASPLTPTVVLGGLDDGRVCIFDIRVNDMPIAISPIHLAHRDPVSSLLYVQSRLNTEFFSGSTDGLCLWWDVRNLGKPTDSMIITIKIPPGETISLANAEPVSVLSFERTIPTRFLCGTDTGLVININRKGKTLQEIMSAVFHAYAGPVKSLQRSPCTTKMFLTCGDWTVHIWSDDVQTSPIISGMPHRYQINDAVWAPQRYSSYMTVSVDGKVRIWDILRKYHEPLVMMPLSKFSLLKIKPHDEGKLIAVGDVKGTIYLVSLSEHLSTSGEKDKHHMAQAYERETRREHILEARIKEIRLKLKTEEEAVPVQVEMVDEEEELRTAEEVYRKTVTDECRKYGIAEKSSVAGQMRKR